MAKSRPGDDQRTTDAVADSAEPTDDLVVAAPTIEVLPDAPPTVILPTDDEGTGAELEVLDDEAAAADVNSAADDDSATHDDGNGSTDDGTAGTGEAKESAASTALPRTRLAGGLALAFVMLAAAAGILTKYPDLRGTTSIASKTLGFDATDLPLILRRTEILAKRERVEVPGIVAYNFATPIKRTPWTIETDAVSQYTEVRFDQVDDVNLVGVRQIVQYGGWEVFRRVNGVDSRLGWIYAAQKENRPLVVVRTADLLTVKLGNELVATVQLAAPTAPSTVGLGSILETPQMTYFDVREAD